MELTSNTSRPVFPTATLQALGARVERVDLPSLRGAVDMWSACLNASGGTTFGEVSQRVVCGWVCMGGGGVYLSSRSVLLNHSSAHFFLPPCLDVHCTDKHAASLGAVQVCLGSLASHAPSPLPCAHGECSWMESSSERASHRQVGATQVRRSGGVGC